MPRGSTLVAEALGFLRRLPRLGLCFDASVRDEFVGEVAVGYEVGEHSAGPFRGFSPSLYLGSGGSTGSDHVVIVLRTPELSTLATRTSSQSGNRIRIPAAVLHL